MAQVAVRTKTLDIACEVSGPAPGRSVLLVHGWPDDARTWDGVLPALHAAGWRTIVPYLRGFGATRFRSERAARTGQLAALGQDLIDLADALELSQFAVVGHDWGARAAYIAAGLWPDRVSHCVTLSVGYGTNDPKQQLSLRQARNYWYHWYMGLEFGARVVREEGKALARFLWETWSPNWRFPPSEFDTTAKSFENPDWADVVLHSYRHRWGLAAGDPAYDEVEKALSPPPKVRVPTLVIHGGSDLCNDPATSAGREEWFTAGYERIVLGGLGHFPQRESPESIARHVTSFLKSAR